MALRKLRAIPFLLLLGVTLLPAQAFAQAIPFPGPGGGAHGPCSGTIPTTNLSLWLDANCFGGPGGSNPADNTTLSTSTTWKDRSSNANNATPNTDYSVSCVYHTNLINGLPGIDSTNKLCNMSLVSGITATTSRTVFAVLIEPDTTHNQILTGSSASGHAFQYTAVFFQVDSVSREQGVWDQGNNKTCDKGTATADTSNWHQVNVQWTDSSNAVFRLDRAADTTIHFNSCTFTTNAIDRLFYEKASSNNHFKGKIAELIYYSGTLSGTDLTTVETYLHDKYGL